MIKLYDTLPYETKFNANIIDIIQENNRFALVLDKSLFFPEEGGQSHDRGMINTCDVSDVQIKNDVIFHYINGKNINFNVGDNINAEIDWAYRFSNMQLHTAEHIFSGLVNKQYGYNNSGFHLSDNIATMDFDGYLSPETVEALELLVNEAIYKNIATKSSYPSPEALQSMNYRSKKVLDKALRIVEIEGYDTCACCAPHVSRTGEIGIFKILSCTSHRGGVRISYLAGRRAFEFFKSDYDLLSRLYKTLSANKLSLEATVENLISQKEVLVLELSNIYYKDLLMQFNALDKNSDLFIIFNKSMDLNIGRRALIDFLKESKGIVALMLGDELSGYKYIIASESIDIKPLHTEFIAEFKARGGGNAGLFQGSINAKMADIECFLNAYIAKLN